MTLYRPTESGTMQARSGSVTFAQVTHAIAPPQWCACDDANFEPARTGFMSYYQCDACLLVGYG